MNNTDTTDNAAKTARKPRAKKAPAAQQAPAQDAHAAPVPSATATAARAAVAGLCVLVTLPPEWKMHSENASPYWQIEVQDAAGKRYSDVYRVKDLDKAHGLAERMAGDRKLPIVTREAPARQTPPKAEPIPMPDPEQEDADGSDPAPF